MRAHLANWIATLALLGTTGTAFAAAAPDPQVGAYFTSWSVGRGFRLKDFDRSGAAAGFTFLIYAFGNVYRMPDGTYRCAGGRDAEDGDDGAGMNATLDYARRFEAGESVDGSADAAQAPLAGNFGQLARLKARHPQLKVLVALGGGTWSRWFPKAAATPALRRTLVASCLDLYVRGNLPRFAGHGGPGAAAGLFDGIDVDWEHPGPGDKANFTALLAEFRRQLDALGKAAGKRYLLTAAINSTEDKVRYTDPGAYSRALDWINLMTYDFHGSWEGKGPTGFHANLYPDPASPDGVDQAAPRSVDTGVRRFLAAGVPAHKIVVGVPFYARGWGGVPSANRGLYQPASGLPPGAEEGAQSYAALAARATAGYYDPVTHAKWLYEGGSFWSYDDPQVIRDKAGYVHTRGLRGLMAWSLDQDDADFALSRAMLDVRGAH